MGYSTLELSEVERILRALTDEGARSLAAHLNGENVEFGEFTIGQLIAGLHRLMANVSPVDRPAILEALINNRQRATLTFTDISRLLVDSNGRCIPLKPE